QRLATPAAATCPDLRPGVDRPRNQDQVWYLQYHDRQGQTCQAKLTLAQVIQKLREGKLTARTEAARFPQGNFQPLSTYVEFQDVLQAIDESINGKHQKSRAAHYRPHVGWWIALGSGVAIVLLLMGTLLLWLRGT